MKWIRFIADDGHSYVGVVDSPDDKKAWLVNSRVPGDATITGQTALVKQYLPPVSPINIIGIGLNYAKHADETGISYPDFPVMFLKSTSSLTAHLEPIILPHAGPDEVDYEAELAVVIGKAGKNVREEDAINYVLGYCCSNDVSARDWQIHKQKKQWARGKSFDTFCPLGPCLVSKDEIPDPNNLTIKTEINGTVFQESNTADMIFSVSQLISQLSRSMTLLPGTVILTGTPEGVGFTRKPPVYLKEGDRVTVTIENLGSLTNPVVREKG